MARPACPSGKRRWSRRPAALRALRAIRQGSVRDRVPRRVYLCGRCAGWHLTAQ